jgi:hypothetical protein
MVRIKRGEPSPMLSSRDTLFAWSKADRARAESLFRAASQRWQPIVRPREADAAAPTKHVRQLPKCIRPRPNWTPWLLVN